MKMLIESVPIPNPEMKWRERIKLKEETGEFTQIKKTGCKFYDRCPEAMDVCRNKTPSLKEVENNHWVACFLYET